MIRKEKKRKEKKRKGKREDFLVLFSYKYIVLLLE
jgi:hypothetical protein